MKTGEMSAFILAAYTMRRVAPGAGRPVFARSQRFSAGWVLRSAEGEPLATVTDMGEVKVHDSRDSNAVGEARVDVITRIDQRVESRWQCACGARWVKLGRHDGTFHTCRVCGHGVWLRLSPDPSSANESP